MRGKRRVMGNVQIPISAFRNVSYGFCEEVLLTSRPVIFEDKIQTSPDGDSTLFYGIKGSSFVFKLDNIYYIATAKHVVKDATDCPYDNVCILISTASSIFFPINQANKVEDFDLLLFRIDSALLEKEHPSSFPFYAFQKPLQIPVLKKGDTVYTRGFPSFNNWVDYDKLTVKTQGLYLRGTIQDDSPFDHSFRIKWFESDIEGFLHDSTFGKDFSIDGMSGSPVFHAGSCTFAGILTNGSLSCGHALRHYVLFNTFEQL